MVLSELKAGQTATIISLPKGDLLSKRLINMGYHVNMNVTHILEKGDLSMYRIGDSLISLKKSQVMKILIEK